MDTNSLASLSFFYRQIVSLICQYLVAASSNSFAVLLHREIRVKPLIQIDHLECFGRRAPQTVAKQLIFPVNFPVGREFG